MAVGSDGPCWPGTVVLVSQLLGRQVLLELVGDQAADQVLLSIHDGASLAGLALKLGGLLRQDVTTVRFVESNFSATSDLETLRSSAVGLHFRHDVPRFYLLLRWCKNHHHLTTVHPWSLLNDSDFGHLFGEFPTLGVADITMHDFPPTKT